MTALRQGRVIPSPMLIRGPSVLYFLIYDLSNISDSSLHGQEMRFLPSQFRFVEKSFRR